MGDTPGILFTESTRGMHLYFQMISNNNGVLDSIFVVPTSANVLENEEVQFNECLGNRM